jgi:hypothetical protein
VQQVLDQMIRLGRAFDEDDLRLAFLERGLDEPGGDRRMVPHRQPVEVLGENRRDPLLQRIDIEAQRLGDASNSVNDLP